MVSAFSPRPLEASWVPPGGLLGLREALLGAFWWHLGSLVGWDLLVTFSSSLGAPLAASGALFGPWWRWPIQEGKGSN
eukprot:188822-Pyramimonas_sp.AAC.1